MLLIAEERHRSSRPGPRFLAGALVLVLVLALGLLIASSRGAEVIVGDLDDRHALERGCRSADTVFHVAGRVGVWGPPEDFFRVNVGGTRHVIAACRDAKVPRLVYTSSPSVVYNGGDLAGVDESAPLCAAAPCAYPTSKAAAEKLVLAANDRGLATVALRPHLIWGPGDPHLLPRVFEKARQGRLRIVGDGANKVSVSYVENAAAVVASSSARSRRRGDPAARQRR